MSNMIERVGRALAKEEGYAYDEFPYDARARAAIEAMRDPTDEMIKAVGSHYGTALESDWQAMIDAALQSAPCWGNDVHNAFLRAKALDEHK